MPNGDDDRAKAALKLTEYITETPPDKYPELTAIPLTQALNLSMMDMFSKATGICANQMENIREWWYERERNKIRDRWAKYTAEDKVKLKKKGLTLDIQLKKYEYTPDDYAEKAINLCDEFRISLYKHYRSVKGKHLNRMTALAETEMTANLEDEELDEHEH